MKIDKRVKQFCPEGHDTFICGRDDKGMCNICKPIKIKLWRKNNKKQVRILNKRWKKEHPEKVKESNKKSYRTNIEHAHNWQLLYRYGLSLERYNELLKQQNYSCKICGRKDPGAKTKKFFPVDHDHKTGNIRGLLCFQCNTILGLANDNVILLNKVIEYLMENFEYNEN